MQRVESLGLHLSALDISPSVSWALQYTYKIHVYFLLLGFPHCDCLNCKSAWNTGVHFFATVILLSVSRVAAYFGLEHNVDPMDKTCVVVCKGPNTRM